MSLGVSFKEYKVNAILIFLKWMQVIYVDLFFDGEHVLWDRGNIIRAPGKFLYNDFVKESHSSVYLGNVKFIL